MQRADFSLWCLLLLRSTGSRVSGCSSFGSRALEHRPGSMVLSLSCSEACGIFPGQGSNPCLLHWQVGSAPLSHQGSPQNYFQITVSFHPHSHIRQVREDIRILASRGDGLSLLRSLLLRDCLNCTDSGGCANELSIQGPPSPLCALETVAGSQVTTVRCGSWTGCWYKVCQPSHAEAWAQALNSSKEPGQASDPWSLQFTCPWVTRCPALHIQIQVWFTHFSLKILFHKFYLRATEP